MKKQTKETNKDRIINALIPIIIMIGIAFIIVIILNLIGQKYFPFGAGGISVGEDYNYTTYEQFLDKVQNDCGSTYFVKNRWLTNNEWKIFKQICKGEYCKYDYVKLQDCLK